MNDTKRQTPAEANELFIKVINDQLKRKNISVRELAKNINRPHTSIYENLTNKKKMRLEIFLEICDELDLLFYLTPSPKND